MVEQPPVNFLEATPTSASRPSSAPRQVFEHLTPVRLLTLGQLRRQDGVERQRSLGPGVPPRPRALGAGPEALKADGVTRANVVGSLCAHGSSPLDPC
jgi:hypothetical protein